MLAIFRKTEEDNSFVIQQTDGKAQFTEFVVEKLEIPPFSPRHTNLRISQDSSWVRTTSAMIIIGHCHNALNNNNNNNKCRCPDGLSNLLASTTQSCGQQKGRKTTETKISQIPIFFPEPWIDILYNKRWIVGIHKTKYFLAQESYSHVIW